MTAIAQQWKASLVFPANKRLKALEKIPRYSCTPGLVWESISYEGSKGHRIAILNCSTITWHKDLDVPGRYTVLWILQSQGFAVQGYRKEPPQDVDTLIVFDHQKMHRLLAPKRGFKGIWIAASLTIDDLDEILSDRREIESWFID